MKEKSYISQRVLWGLLLILLSIFFYALHFLIFRDRHHIFIYLLGDIAFVFIEVLLVTLIIHHILGEREKRAMLKKLNMVIGAFFSEVGTPLLEHFTEFDTNAQRLSKHLVVDNEWSPEHFTQMQVVLQKHDHKIDSRTGNLQGLQSFIVDKRAFLLRLLENPNLPSCPMIIERPDNSAIRPKTKYDRSNLRPSRVFSTAIDHFGLAHEVFLPANKSYSCTS